MTADYFVHARQQLLDIHSPCLNHIRVFLSEVMSVAGWHYDAAAAAEWGANFKFPIDAGNRDTNLLTANNHSLTAAIEALRVTTKDDRLNQFRVVECVPSDDPDFKKIMDLAVVGVRVFRSDDFRPNTAPPPLRPLYVQTSCAVNRMIYDLHGANLLLILPLSYTNLHLSHMLHFTPLHWAKKNGKPCGRPIFDASDKKFGSLNSKDATAKAEAFYGSIKHPTLTDIVLMILDFEEAMQSMFGDLFCSSQLVLFKHDLRRAFMLLDFAVCDSCLLASAMTDDLVVIHHTGVFGLGGMPFAFQVITGVIQRSLSRLKELTGYLLMYVDDIIGITLRAFLVTDNIVITDFCRKLLGSTAIAEDKSESGRRLDVLGYDIDLDSRRVSISYRNLLTFGFHLFSVDLTVKVSVRTLQQLASLASRYSSILRCMKVFTSALYGNFTGVLNLKALQAWHPEAIVAVQLWRVVLVHLRFNRDTLARPMASFRRKEPSHVITFDASLSGCGFVVRKFVGATTEENKVIIADTGDVVSVGRLVFDRLAVPMQFGSDSSYQNTAEFIAVVFAIACLKERGIQHTGLALRGDSVTALTWSSSERFKSRFAKPAALVFLLLCLEEGIEVSMTEHLCAEHNSTCDGLSRSDSVRAVCDSLRVDYLTVNATLTKRVVTLVSLCNNETTMSSFEDVRVFWRRVSDEVINQ